VTSTRTSGVSDPGLLILMSLAEGDKHGYAIMKDVESFAGVALGAGTLYGALARLEQRGQIEAQASDDPRRRPYRLTSAGRQALQSQLDSLEGWTRVARLRLATTPSS
jgi:DNA-binding PadR family transcriptional regulator